jgi:hypothetical protein
MPQFGGFNLGSSLLGGLATNVVASTANAIFPQTTFGGFGTGSSTVNGQVRTLTADDAADRRVSLRPKPKAVDRVLGKGLLDPLRKTNNGMIWPYTPNINYSHGIDYQTIQTVHTNQDFHVFSKAPAVELSVDGTFTVQNQLEGQYAMACIHFMRTVTKMNFGQNDPNAGTPPPILLFNAYGPFVFNDLPVIVKQFSVTFPEDVDYVEVNTNTTTPFSSPSTPSPKISNDSNSSINNTSQSSSNYVWLPSMFKISATLVVQHTPNTLRTNFNLPQFVNGNSSQRNFI